jgi:hypothetical protein
MTRCAVSEFQICVVMRLSDSGPRAVVRGSEQGNCQRCSEPVWISPTSNHAICQGAEVVCSRCLRPVELDRMKPALLPGQLGEIAAHFHERPLP